MAGVAQLYYRLATLSLGNARMTMMLDEIVVVLGLLAVSCFTIEFAYRVGRRSAAADEAARPHLWALQTGLISMMSLLLGFSFAMAGSRFDARKNLVQDEVNAVGSSFLRAQLLPVPERRQVSDLLRGYVAARLASMNAGGDAQAADTAEREAERIETSIWSLVSTDAPTGPDALTFGLFVQSLNDIYTITQKRRAALQNHVPAVVLGLLLVVALGTLGFIAYTYGFYGKRRHVSTAVFALLVTLVFTVIVDLDQPHSGLIRLEHDGLLRLQHTLQGIAPQTARDATTADAGRHDATAQHP